MGTRGTVARCWPGAAPTHRVNAPTHCRSQPCTTSAQKLNVFQSPVCPVSPTPACNWISWGIEGQGLAKEILRAKRRARDGAWLTQSPDSWPLDPTQEDKEMQQPRSLHLPGMGTIAKAVFRLAASFPGETPWTIPSRIWAVRCTQQRSTTAHPAMEESCQDHHVQDL